MDPIIVLSRVSTMIKVCERSNDIPCSRIVSTCHRQIATSSGRGMICVVGCGVGAGGGGEQI